MHVLSSEETTQKAFDISVKKWSQKFSKTFMLWILGWAFIAMWAAFSVNTLAWLATTTPYWIMKMLGWLAFCLWLILVVIWWWELFTWNVLLIVWWLKKKVSSKNFFKNLVAVYLWNFIWSMVIVLLLFFWGFHTFWPENAVWQVILKMATHKSEIWFLSSFFLWIVCNIYVCLAIWLCYSWKSATDKILTIIFPITAFAAIWFEHSVANMFYLPYWFLINNFSWFDWTWSDKVLNIPNMLLNSQLPSTIWNFIWWAIFVWLIYWFIHLRKD